MFKMNYFVISMFIVFRIVKAICLFCSISIHFYFIFSFVVTIVV